MVNFFTGGLIMMMLCISIILTLLHGTVYHYVDVVSQQNSKNEVKHSNKYYTAKYFWNSSFVVLANDFNL